MQAAADLLWSPVLRKFPDLQVALSEGGIGWIPYFLDRVDYVYRSTTTWTGQDFGGRLPSEVFRERIVTCFIDDPAGVADRDRIDIDHDHAGSATTRTPTRRGRPSPETLWPALDGVPDDDDRQDHARERDAALPASTRSRHRPAEQCTVGALRAEATDVDVTPRARTQVGGRRS